MASLSQVALYALLGGLTLSVFIEIVQRFIPGVPLYGITEIITLFSAYLYLLAMAYVTYRKRHVTVDILHMVVKNESIIGYLELLGLFICIVVCFVYDYLAFQYCYGVAITKQTTPDIGYPRIFLVSCLVIGLTITNFFLVLYFINAIKLKITGR